MNACRYCCTDLSTRPARARFCPPCAARREAEQSRERRKATGVKHRLPATPLAEIIARRSANFESGGYESGGYAGGGRRGLNGLARNIAYAAGRDTDSTARLLWRLASQQWVEVATADELCVALGMHISEVYPDWLSGA